jgi:endogenous inhibitor of DNA gyrase (YacG/DUF329 family)
MKHLFQWGSEYLIGKKEEPCTICGKPTKLIEIFFEAPICSFQCQKKIDRDYIKWASRSSSSEEDF